MNKNRTGSNVLAVVIIAACGRDNAGQLNGPCADTTMALFQCAAGLNCDVLGDGSCKPADIFGKLDGPCAHAPGVAVNPTCDGGLTCEIPGQGRATRCANVLTVVLTPDGMGRIDGSTNSLGVQGNWYPYGDSIGSDGAAPGDCQNAGYATNECSNVATPVPGMGSFAPISGMGMCASGIAAMVISGSDGTADYSHIWGAGIALDLNNSGATSTTRMPYDAAGNRVTGIEFDLDTDPPRPPPGANAAGLHVEFPTTTASSNSAYWSPVTRGHNIIVWPQLSGPLDPATGTRVQGPVTFDPSRLLSIEFHVRGAVAGSIAYAFCINNLTAMME